mgnify:FL=1
MPIDTDTLIARCKIVISEQMQASGKLQVIESYARFLNQLLEAKQREVNIEHTQKQIPKTSP